MQIRRRIRPFWTEAWEYIRHFYTNLSGIWWDWPSSIGGHRVYSLGKHRKFEGECFLFYFFWYGLGRAWIEGLRTDSLYLFSTGIRVSQLLSIVCAAAAGGILAWKLFKKQKN